MESRANGMGTKADKLDRLRAFRSSAASFGARADTERDKATFTMVEQHRLPANMSVAETALMLAKVTMAIARTPPADRPSRAVSAVLDPLMNMHTLATQKVSVSALG